MVDDVFYKSNKQKKIEERKVIQLETLSQKRKQKAEQRWVDSQIKAAGWQSVLDHAVEQFNLGKEELEEEVVTKTEEMIKERQKEIETYLMTEKDIYREAMGTMAD